MVHENKKGASSLLSTVQTTLLNDITSSISEQARASTFSCGDTVPIRKTSSSDIDTKTLEPVQVRFGDSGKGVVLNLPLDSDNDKESLKQLLDTCSPASFGRGGEDVIDENYRKASKLDTDKFLTLFCPYNTGIIDVISQLLLPNAIGTEPRGVKAELYKLNVYSAPSGQFKAHVDTPWSSAQFGSLVVCLPLAHQGGELAVRSHGKEVIFDWSTNSDDLSADPEVKWAAFYSDCEHEVWEVTAGDRVTLTYNLYSICQPQARLQGTSQGFSIRLHCLSTPLFGPRSNPPGFFKVTGRILAVWLTHSYAHTHDKVNFLPSSLKGADMALFETARSLGLQCLIRPVVSFSGHRWNEHGDEELEGQLMGNAFHRFKASGQEIDEYSFEERLEGFRRDFPSEEIDARKITWLNQSDKKLEEPAIAYIAYGNQASLGIEYSAAAMLIRIPPFEKRGVSADPEASFFDGITIQEATGHEDET